MIHATALLLYITAFILWLRVLLRGDAEQGTGVASWVAAAGVGVHFLALGLFTARYDQLPLVGLAPSLSTLSLIVGVGLVATLGLGEANRVGILLVPLVIALEALALVLGIEPAAENLDFRGAWFALHVTLAFSALAAMALSAAAGALWLLQFRELKSKRLGRVFHFLPPLAVLNRIGRVAAVTGFTLLTLALGLGWAWTVHFRNSLESGDPKILWAVFTWGVILAAVILRLGRKGAPKRGAAASVVGFVLIVAAYVVVRVAMGGTSFL